jgi:NAD(P)-dependent dehydrogenase (short-subunit alcohol dehydrogenase family)
MPGPLFENRIVLITGAATGIGRASALAFAREGASLALVDIDTVQMEQTAKAAGELGAKTLCLQVDVAQVAQVQKMVSDTVSHFGRLDCAFNNAGVAGGILDLAQSTEENWDRVININLKSVWASMKYELQQMLTQGSGSIVNTASVLGLVGGPVSPAYTASKHGVIGLTKSAAIAYAPKGIRINAVCPGYIETPLIDKVMTANPEYRPQVIARHPIGRMGTAEEIAAAVLWLSSDSASFVTGLGLAADGGFTAQ